jgi:hypothetical protein
VRKYSLLLKCLAVTLLLRLSYVIHFHNDAVLATHTPTFVAIQDARLEPFTPAVLLEPANRKAWADTAVEESAADMVCLANSTQSTLPPDSTARTASSFPSPGPSPLRPIRPKYWNVIGRMPKSVGPSLRRAVRVHVGGVDNVGDA